MLLHRPSHGPRPVAPEALLEERERSGAWREEDADPSASAAGGSPSLAAGPPGSSSVSGFANASGTWADDSSGAFSFFDAASEPPKPPERVVPIVGPMDMEVSYGIIALRRSGGLGAGDPPICTCVPRKQGCCDWGRRVAAPKLDRAALFDVLLIRQASCAQWTLCKGHPISADAAAADASVAPRPPPLPPGPSGASLSALGPAGYWASGGLPGPAAAPAAVDPAAQGPKTVGPESGAAVSGRPSQLLAQPLARPLVGTPPAALAAYAGASPAPAPANYVTAERELTEETGLHILRRAPLPSA